MKFKTTTTHHKTAEPVVSTQTLEIRIARDATGWKLSHQIRDEEHQLGAGCEAGDRLCQFVLEDGQPVAFLIWCAAAWQLQDRDKIIRWDPVARALCHQSTARMGSDAVLRSC